MRRFSLKSWPVFLLGLLLGQAPLVCATAQSMNPVGLTGGDNDDDLMAELEAETERDLEAVCTIHSDCPLTKKCSGGQCVPLAAGDCAADADCSSTDDYCEVETRSCRALCPDDGFCLGLGEYCDPQTHHCLRSPGQDGDADSDGESGSFCTSAAGSCPNGYYCDVYQRICRKYCTSGQDCTASEVCADRQCQARVLPDGDSDASPDGDIERIELVEGYDTIDEDFEFKELDNSACPAGQVCIDKAEQKSGSGCSQNAGAVSLWLLLGALSGAWAWRRGRRATSIATPLLLAALLQSWPLQAGAIDSAPNAEKVAAAIKRGVQAKDTPAKLYQGYEFGTLGSEVNGYVQTKLCEIALRAAALSSSGKTAENVTTYKDILDKQHVLIPIYIPAAKEADLSTIRVELRQGLKTRAADELLKDPVRRVLCQEESCLYARDVYAGFWYEHFDSTRVAVLVVHVGSRFYEFPLAFERMD